MITAYEQMRTLISDGLVPNEGQTAVVWRPDPRNRPQCMAYELAKSGDVMEIGFGGQGGGGKTDLLIGLGATVFKESRIMRRELPQLDGVIKRGNALFPVRFVHGSKKSWQFDGHTIALRSMPQDSQWKKYQGQELDYLGIDEAAEFTEDGIRALTGWLRSAEDKNTLVVMCFNPPTTPEGQWIVEYFGPWLDPKHPNPAESGEIRWLAHMPTQDNREKIIEVADGTPFVDEISGETVYPISRTFIKATRRDNPFLGEEYERRLQNLPEPLRTIIKDGDFTIGTQDDPWQVIPTNWVLEAQKRWETTPKPDGVALRALGEDVAHGGADDTVVVALYGVWFDEPDVYAGSSTPNGEAAARAVEKRWDGKAPIGVDGIGYGAAAADTMISWGMHPLVINFGAASNRLDPSARFGFFNERAECYWSLREALDPKNGQEICLPSSRRLRADLCAPRFKIVRGKIQIEPKEDIKKRLGRSPDEGDTVVLCWRAAQTFGVPIVLDW